MFRKLQKDFASPYLCICNVLLLTAPDWLGRDVSRIAPQLCRDRHVSTDRDRLRNFSFFFLQ